MKSTYYASLLALATLLGCMPMGLPEKFSRPTGQSPGKTVQIVRPIEVETLAQEGDTLGTQYLLGVIPLTRLYLPHGNRSQLTEILAQLLLDHGYQVALTESASSPLPLSASIRPEIRKLRVNSFDLFFLRSLSITGYLILDTTTGGSTHTLEIPFEYQQFKKFGLAPTLAFLLRKTVRDQLEQTLPKLIGRSPYPQPPTDGDSAILLFPPDVSRLEETDISILQSSYGFAETDFTESDISRILQRGLEFGLKDLSIQSVSLLGTGKTFPSLNRLESAFTIKPNSSDKMLRIKGTFRLFSANSATPILKSCEGNFPLKSNLDGYWIRAMESANRELIKAFFTKMDYQHIVCSQNS